MPDLVASKEGSSQSDLESLLARSAAKDRTTIQKHLSLLESEGDPAHAALWRRLVGSMAALAPMPLQASGQGSIMFFIPDGKYRMQVFALEDQRDGRIALYLPNVLNEAIKRKILKKGDVPDEYSLGRSARTTIHVELLDSQNTPEPPAHMKNMLGWNRKAMRVSLPTTTSDGPKVEAAEALFDVAAKQFAKPG